MQSIVCILVFFGFYFLYSTSKKTTLRPVLNFEKWIDMSLKSTQVIAISLLFVAYLLSIYLDGMGSGTLLFFIVLMTIGSLIIVLVPLKIINNKALLSFFIIVTLFEIYYY